VFGGFAEALSNGRVMRFGIARRRWEKEGVSTSDFLLAHLAGWEVWVKSGIVFCSRKEVDKKLGGRALGLGGRRC